MNWFKNLDNEGKAVISIFLSAFSFGSAGFSGTLATTFGLAFGFAFFFIAFVLILGE